MTIALLGLVLGLRARSSAIIFDSVYELADVVITWLGLLVARLIALSTVGEAAGSRLTERFTMGFWHLEPIVLGLNGVLLTGAAVYALINAIDSFIAGGRHINFTYAIVFSAVTLVLQLGTGVLVLRANRSIRSDIVAMDARSWLMSSAMTVGYLAAFGFGALVRGTRLDGITPYIDPAVLMLVCLFVIPIPIPTVRQALADILLVTPRDLKSHVDEVAQAMVQRHGFDGYHAYVARVGRGEQIELSFLVPQAWPAMKLAEWDNIRDSINEALGEDSPHRWLTIVFTTDPEWA
jgi:predicted Co/Zn/Cd cation transporter (cation efflux family)